MRRIVGYVLVQGTNAGIGRLVVTAFDTAVCVEDLRRMRPGPALMQALGRRISSVMTDRSGRFVLSADDLEFAGNEPRPNLAVAVFAPEDIRDPHIPIAAPPEERVLYISLVPRTDAGAQEAFVIRLKQDQIANLQLDHGASRAIAEVEHSWRMQDAVKARLASRYAEERARRATAATIAKERTKDLSGVPLALRSHELLVIGKAKLNEKVAGPDRTFVTRGELLQQEVVRRGLSQLARSKVRPTMSLLLTKADLSELGLRQRGGELVGKATSEELAAKVRKLMGGVDLVRTRGDNNPSPEALEAKYLNAPEVDRAKQPR